MSVSQRFWGLVLVVLFSTFTFSAVAIWYTATPFLQNNQSGLIRSQAEKNAKAFETLLAQFEQLLQFVAAQENVVSVVIGFVENPAVVSDYFETLPSPKGLRSVTLYDAFNEVVAQAYIDNATETPKLEADTSRIFEQTSQRDEQHGSSLVRLLHAGAKPRVMMSVPIRNRGLIEGVLVAKFDVNLDQIFSASNITRSLYVDFPDPEKAMTEAQEGNWIRLVVNDQLALISTPDVEATAAVGRTLLLNVTAAISAVLVFSFSVFAWLGRTAIILPHKELELQKDSLAELAAVAENANDAILVTDLQQRILWGNPAFEVITGYKIEDVRGKIPGRFLQGDDTDPETVCKLGQAIRDCKPIKVQLLKYSRHGKPYWINISVTPLTRHDGEVYGFMAISHDVTVERRQREQIDEANRTSERLARHDALTGLPNRRVLNEELDRRAKTDAPDATLLRIDLDHFKNVNDTMGHDAGDHVLKIVADILNRSVRKSDIPARVGGDEFIVLMSSGSTSQDALQLGTRIQTQINALHHFEDKPLRIGASFGVASTLDGLIPYSEIVSSADAALYKGKDLGRNKVVHYDEQLHEAVCFNRQVSIQLHQALEKDEFEPFFQPQICARTGEIFGFEALASWQSPKLGLVPPNVFLPIAAQMARTEEIDACIFRKGLEIAQEIKNRNLPFPKLSFNVTASRIHQLATQLDQKLVPDDGPAIAFEILESVLVEDQSDVFRFALDNIRELGYLIEIDDFGSGHASVVGLVHIQPDFMKIDQQLVIPVLESETSANLLRSIIEMGKTIGVGIIAEGVEPQEHASVLSALGCDVLQGYYFSKPLPHHDLVDFLETYQSQRTGPKAFRLSDGMKP